MSKALEKIADMEPGQKALLSALLGSGAFATSRLLSDVSNRMNPPQDPERSSIQLLLQDPYKKKHQAAAAPNNITSLDPAIADQLPELAKAADSEHPLYEYLKPYAIPALAAPAGFLGTKLLYDKYKEHEANQEIVKAKQQYAEQLAAAEALREKSGSATPLVDALCKAAAEEMQKAAALPGELPGDRQAAEGLLAQQAHSALGNMANNVTGNTYNAGKDALGLLIGGTTLGTLALLLHNHAKKREKEQKSVYPNAIEYAG
jgi:hypothetical protein